MVLSVRGDNVGTLTLALKLQTTGPTTSIIARELSFDIDLGSYSSDVAAHIPGVSNFAADYLSWRSTPENCELSLPAGLCDATEIKVETRMPGGGRWRLWTVSRLMDECAGIAMCVVGGVFLVLVGCGRLSLVFEGFLELLGDFGRFLEVLRFCCVFGVSDIF